jgi:hypothetical protein
VGAAPEFQRSGVGVNAAVLFAERIAPSVNPRRAPLAFCGRGDALRSVEHTRQRMQVDPTQAGLVRNRRQGFHVSFG